MNRLPTLPSPKPRRFTRPGFTSEPKLTNPLAELFGGRARAEVLRILFGVGREEFYINEIVRRSGLAQQGVDEQLRIFLALGLLTSRIDGNRRYQANTAHPFYPDLRSLILKSSGLRDVLAEALQSPKIEIAFVFGSIARHEERPESDVDLMVIGDIGLREMSPKIRPLHDKFCRLVNAHFFSRWEIARRLSTNDHFFTRVLSEPKLFIIGDEAGLSRLLAEVRRQGGLSPIVENEIQDCQAGAGEVE